MSEFHLKHERVFADCIKEMVCKGIEFAVICVTEHKVSRLCVCVSDTCCLL